MTRVRTIVWVGLLAVALGTWLLTASLAHEAATITARSDTPTTPDPNHVEPIGVDSPECRTWLRTWLRWVDPPRHEDR